MNKYKAIDLLNEHVAQAKEGLETYKENPDLRDDVYSKALYFIQGMFSAFHLCSVFTMDEFELLENQLKDIEEGELSLLSLGNDSNPDIDEENH